MSVRHTDERWQRRSLVLLTLFALAVAALAVRAVQLHVLDGGFLTAQGDARHLRTVEVPAHRGMILDRHGESLAASTPVDSFWANPSELLAGERIAALADALEIDRTRLDALLRERGDRTFIWLRRHMSPDEAERVTQLDVPGVHRVREYRRYYPAGEVASHLLGFTNIDDAGQEGIELAFDEWLRGEPGRKQVLRDRLGRTVADVQGIRQPRPGRDLTLSIDRRVQYLAYRELKAAVTEHGARGGSIVVLDSRTGEVLAMANQPAFNPNNRQGLVAERYRNRAATDVLEPGSSFKPFVIAAALQSGRFDTRSRIDTSPGLLQVRGGTIRDVRDNGVIDIATLLTRSSNVGASRIALDLDPEQVWTMLQAFGFGQPTASGFPGEQAGLLNHFVQWREIGLATLSYGYGISVTPLQLAQAYAVIAADGVRHPVTLIRSDEPLAAGERVLSTTVARDMRRLLEVSLGPDSTATGARVRGYRVAGKTGTARKSTAGGYALDRHTAAFAGMAPASNPRLVTVVVIDEPSRGAYYGGQVAAPVFGRVMSGALRLLDIPPDELPTVPASVIAAGPQR
ncbi:MAG: penicillin-binding protein 2 [Xanthomonadaceae bacterium]|nr:penicillin-binding protein 2 [Xanthomonadaceae bacterium]